MAVAASRPRTSAPFFQGPASRIGSALTTERSEGRPRAASADGITQSEEEGPGEHAPTRRYLARDACTSFGYWLAPNRPIGAVSPQPSPAMVCRDGHRPALPAGACEPGRGGELMTPELAWCGIRWEGKGGVQSYENLQGARRWGAASKPYISR